jgi:squalene-hopene/tetraprenyl-beta-curcumene cyclase
LLDYALQMSPQTSPHPSRTTTSRTEGAVLERSASGVSRAIAAAFQRLLSLQKPDGHWCGELEGDSILESEYVITLHFLGRLDDPRVGKAADSLRQIQLPEGGWSIYPGGPSEISSSVKAYLVLKLAGDDPEASHMRRAREKILDLGGIEACNSFTKIYLSLCGEYDWWRCPAVPPEMILLPRWISFNLYEISSWSRAIVVPLSVIWAKRPVRPLPPGKGIAELFSPDAAKTPQKTFGGVSRFWRLFFHTLDAALKTWERLHLRPFRRRALARAEHWILARLENSDGLGAIFPPIVNTIMALCCLGHRPDDPIVGAQIAELERLIIEDDQRFRLQPCFSSTWDTAIAVHTLADLGVPADHPALAKGRSWILDHEVRETGDWAVKLPTTPPGGWYFEYRNEAYPDCDDTAEVLAAFGAMGMPDHPASRRGLSWMLAMQNDDGGWGAFDRDCDNEILTHVPFADHNALLDPSTADVTARTLDALSRLGLPGSHPAVQRTIAFLRNQQDGDGSWYGRWGCNYLYGTWLALRGLSRYVETEGQSWSERACRWIASVQNADGGWGESPLSYDDPTQKGVGDSTSAQTAWALMGLFSAGVRKGPVVERGVDYLLRTQRPDGSWYDESWTGTGFPRVFYLRYHLYALFFPLTALAEYEHGRETSGRSSIFPQEVSVHSAVEVASR